MAFSPWHTRRLACVGQGILTLQLLWGQAGVSASGAGSWEVALEDGGAAARAWLIPALLPPGPPGASP